MQFLNQYPVGRGADGHLLDATDSVGRGETTSTTATLECVDGFGTTHCGDQR